MNNHYLISCRWFLEQSQFKEKALDFSLTDKLSASLSKVKTILRSAKEISTSGKILLDLHNLSTKPHIKKKLNYIFKCYTFRIMLNS